MEKVGKILDLSEKLKEKKEKEEISNPAGDIFGNEEQRATLEEVEKIDREVDEKWEKAKAEIDKKEKEV